MDEDTAQHGGQYLDKAELRSGMVLNQELKVRSHLRQGYVLTDDDIQIIQKSAYTERISVLILKKREAEDMFVAKPAPSSGGIEIPKNFAPLAGKDRVNALFDPTLDKTMKIEAEIKKNHIRGEDYQEKVEKQINDHLDKFKNTLKAVPQAQKKVTTEVIEKYAKASADIEGLMQVKGASEDELLSKMNLYEQYCDIFMQSILKNKQVLSGYVENIVLDIMSDIGYQLTKGIFVSLSKMSSYKNYITAHTLQVLIIALVTAIELSKMINIKAQKLDEKDINIFLSIHKKSFNLEELVNLGVSALLHDIDYRKQIPGLTPDYRFSLQESSLYDLHPSNGFHLAKTLNIDYEVQRAVFQHHELWDGTGFPSGLQPRFFTKYTSLLSFAEYYVEMTTPNPFVSNIVSPRDLIVALLTRQKTSFDGDVVYSFIKSASLYPVGSWLALSNGELGVVHDVNRDSLERPKLMVYFERGLKLFATPYELDLATSQVTILKPIPITAIQKITNGNMDFIFKKKPA